MKNRWKVMLKHLVGQLRKQPFRRGRLQLEQLESRFLPSAAPFQHVLLLSVDGLHQADVADPVLQASVNPANGQGVLHNIVGLQNQGVTYNNAFTTSPSDSFPGELSVLTGAHPGTTGVFYDDGYDRKLLPPAIVGSSTPGTETLYAENLDFTFGAPNPNLSGTDGTNGFDASAIDPTQLPLSKIIAVNHEKDPAIVVVGMTVYQLANTPIVNDGQATGSIFTGSHTPVATFTVPHVDANPNQSNSANDIVPLQFTTGGSNFSAGTLNLASGVLTLTWSSLPPPATSAIDISYNYGVTVLPHQFLKVNTIFNVAHDAGLPTAYSDKHPAYEIANGPSGNGVDDFFAPEINSNAALEAIDPLDPNVGHTINADVLRDTNPFADLTKYKLVYAATDPDGASDPNLEDITHNVLLAEKYDDVKVQAILNEINGENSRGTSSAPVPAIFGMNFQAVSVAQKYSKGGIDIIGGVETPSNLFLSALQHTDASLGAMEDALKANGLWSSTMMVVTAKHGQDPRIGSGIKMADNQIPDVVGANLAQATQDDVSVLWLTDQSKTADAVAALTAFKNTGTVHGRDAQNNVVTLPANQVIDKILYGQALVNANLGDPQHNTRTPDIIVTLKPGFIWVGNEKNKFKRAEHGGFNPDDTHVALIVSSGGLSPDVQGSVQDGAVETTQVAVTALKALGLNPDKLQGAQQEGTKELPGLKADALKKIDHFVVIYQENWSFDGLYGSFPGANGLNNAQLAGTIPQVDVNGNLLIYTPSPLNNGVIDPNFPSVVIGGKSYLAYPAIDANTGLPDPKAGLPVPIGPYDLSIYIQPSQITGDIVHKFYHEQLQIDNGNPAFASTVNGSMDKFVAVSDNPGLVMSHFDASMLPEGLLAQQYTMDDNFFHAAYGGSFLNHQFLVAAAAPEWNQAIPNANFVSHPAVNSALTDGGMNLPGHDSNLTGNDLLAGDGNHFVVNTTFTANLVPNFVTPGASTLLKSINDSNPGDLTRPFEQNIGDELSSAGVDWKWYSGGWNAAINLQQAYQSGNAAAIAAAKDPFAPGGPDNLFQWHHQPFAYYDNYSPLSPGGQAHLQDETNFFSDLAAGNLPAVSFIKPLGPDNEHPGYAALLQGQQHVADIVHAIQNSPDWANTAIIITYDEHGGRWDHVTPSANNGPWGDGARVPAIVISPYAKQGYVDHQQHDTLSILKTIEDRFGLAPLNQYDANASSLASSFQTTPHIDLGTAYLQPDANTAGKSVLVVLGTENSDHIAVQPAANDQIEVAIGTSGFDQTFDASQISRIQVYGQGGNDQISVDQSILLPAMIFAGDGNNHIQTGDGNTVVVGGGGKVDIAGGAGRNLLIGAGGQATIDAGSGESIVIAGTTAFGADAEALLAIETEWASNDTRADRIAKITAGVNGGTFALNGTTVFANDQNNLLIGGSGLDWFFANLATDVIDNTFGQDKITPI